MADGNYKLVTVNTAPERAARLVGRMTTALSDRYNITHVGNCEKIDEVAPKVAELQPDVLFCASMWTKEEAEKIQQTARSIRPQIITYALPHGLQVDRGPDAVVEHLVATVPGLLEGAKS